MRKIGNVTADTEITFEFGVKTKADCKFSFVLIVLILETC